MKKIHCVCAALYCDVLQRERRPWKDEFGTAGASMAAITAAVTTKKSTGMETARLERKENGEYKEERAQALVTFNPAVPVYPAYPQHGIPWSLAS